MKSIKRHSGKINYSKNINVFYIILGIGVLLAGLYYLLGKRSFGLKEGATTTSEATTSEATKSEDQPPEVEYEPGDVFTEDSDWQSDFDAPIPGEDDVPTTKSESGTKPSENSTSSENKLDKAKAATAELSEKVNSIVNKPPDAYVSSSYPNAQYSGSTMSNESNPGLMLIAAQNEMQMLQKERLFNAEKELKRATAESVATLSKIQKGVDYINENTNEILARQLTNPRSNNNKKFVIRKKEDEESKNRELSQNQELSSYEMQESQMQSNMQDSLQPQESFV
jgi:hypothetical protein